MPRPRLVESRAARTAESSAAEHSRSSQLDGCGGEGSGHHPLVPGSAERYPDWVSKARSGNGRGTRSGGGRVCERATSDSTVSKPFFNLAAVSYENKSLAPRSVAVKARTASTARAARDHTCPTERGEPRRRPVFPLQRSRIATSIAVVSRTGANSTERRQAAARERLARPVQLILARWCFPEPRPSVSTFDSRASVLITADHGDSDRQQVSGRRVDPLPPLRPRQNDDDLRSVEGGKS